MNFSDKTARQAVDHLIQDLEDGVITPEDRVKLMDLMRRHASVRELYLQHIELAALLHETAKNRATLGTMPVNEQMLQQASRKNAITSLTYAMAAVLVIGLLLMIFQVRQRLGRDVEGIVLETSDNAAYSVTSSGDEPRSDQKLRVGDRVTINQGLARFTFPSGVKAIVEGPSQIVLTSDLSVKMNGGQAWFRVPEAGHGFTVQAQQMDIIDLGTEFGVRFDDLGELQVHVIQGKVKIDPTPRGLKDIELIKGEAMTFDKFSRGTPIKAMAGLFQTKFTTGIPYLHWSFDQLDHGHFQAEGTISSASEYQAELQSLNQEPAPLSGVVSGPVNAADCQTDGPFGKAFSMKGNGLFARTTFPGIGGQIPRTVVAWVRHRVGRDYSDGASYCSWGNPAPGQMWGISMNRQNDLTLSTSTGRSRCGTPIHSSNSPDRWVHIASVYTGITTADGFPQIRHYINGELQPSTQAYKWPEEKSKPLAMNTDISSDAATPLRIGAATADGDLDELYLFRGALSEEQIRQLMEENQLDTMTR
jgi:hypothetical protein